MSSGEPTVGRQVLRALVDSVERAGQSRESFLRALDLQESDLSVSGARVSLRELDEVCRRALAILQDPALGLHWGEGLDERSFGAVSHLLAHAGSLRRGFALLAQFEALLSDRRSYEVVEEAHTMSIRMTDVPFASPELTRFKAEMLLAGMLTVVRAFFARATPTAVRFAYTAPAHRAEYERIFGASVLFDQPRTELVFARELLDHPSSHGDQDMHAAVTTVAERQLVRLRHSTPYSVRLREQLLACWPKRLDMEAAARAFGLSIRTLRRQLTSEGTTYREVEYAVLATVAKRLLCSQGLSIQQTAHEMKFSDAATFHRAFKTWTGVTPSAFRDSALGRSSD